MSVSESKGLMRQTEAPGVGSPVRMRRSGDSLRLIGVREQSHPKDDLSRRLSFGHGAGKDYLQARFAMLELLEMTVCC